MSSEAERVAETELRRAKVKLKLERALARRAEREAHPYLAVVFPVASLVVGVVLMFCGITVLMHQPWRVGPTPLQPITSTTPTITVPPRGGPGECGYPYSDECGRPSPTTTPSTAVSPCGSDPAHPLLNEACGDCQYWHVRYGHSIDGCFDPSEQPGTTTVPIPPDLENGPCSGAGEGPNCPPTTTTEPTHAPTPACPQGTTNPDCNWTPKQYEQYFCEHIKPTPPNCPATTEPTIPGVPGSQQGQAV